MADSELQNGCRKQRQGMRTSLANISSVVFDLAHVDETVNPFSTLSVGSDVHHHSLVMCRRNAALAMKLFNSLHEA